jgi:predicted PurR-regulated permease PerM
MWLLVPQVARQVDQLVEVFPQTLERFTAVLRQYEWGAWLLDRASDGANGDTGVLSSGVGWVGGVFSSSIAAIVNFALVLIIGLYLAAEARMYQRGLLRMAPPAKRERAAEVLDASGAALRGWLLGKVLSMTALGVLSFIGLVILDVRLALTMAVLTALLAFIPNLGAILSVIPPVLLAWADDPWKALYVVIFYIALQNVEGVVITPMIQRRTASLPPALLISTQLFMAAFFGSFGLLLAEPLGALGIVLVKMLYVEDTLGDSVSAPLLGAESESSIAGVAGS